VVPSDGARIALVVDDEAPIVTLFVPVAVDGKPLRLLLDTGSTNTTITPHAAAELGLVADTTTTSTVSVLGGNVDGIPSALVDRLAIGGVEVRDVRVQIEVESSADGLLGMDILAQMVCELDLPHGVLVLYPRGSTRWRGDDLVAVPYTSHDGVIEVEAALGRARVAAVIDSGASPSLANSRAVPRPLDIEVQARGADGRMIPAHVAGGSLPIAVHGVTLGEGLLYVADASGFAALGLAAKPAVIVGIDRFRGHRVVIDAGASTLYLSK